MVMATDALVPVTDHRPAALEMQGQPAASKAETLEVVPGCGGHLSSQVLKIRMAVQLAKRKVKDMHP